MAAASSGSGQGPLLPAAMAAPPAGAGAGAGAGGAAGASAVAGVASEPPPGPVPVETPYRRLSGDLGEVVRRESTILSVANTPLHRSSSRLLRAASTTFTGGAAVLPPAADSVDHLRSRAPSMRLVNSFAVQQRMMEELWNRYRIRISVFMFTLIFFSFTMIFLFYSALFAVIAWGSLPCDQPLNMYLFTSVFVGQVTPQMVKFLQTRRWAQNPRLLVAISIGSSLPGWIVIIWGLKMLASCRTCQTTNPNLFYPTKHVIYGQMLLFVLTTLFFSIGFRGVLIAFMGAAADRVRPGCEAAVHALPKVAEDDPELLDPEDGNVMDCPICAESFAGGSTVTKAIVRTHCGHHFHEQCLARWCKNHMDCPMCRSAVGEPDAAAAA